MSKKLIVEVHHDAKIRQLIDAQNVPSGMMMVEGVFGRVDSVNRNNRIYSKAEYSKHVSLLSERIAKENGVLGEMEHPKSMNIDLNNVSHKIVSVQVDEDGFVRGRALLLDTPKGLIAQSIVRSGLALPISSRAMGQVTENNMVKLDKLETFDLVGTAGFSETGLKKLFESKDEDGNILHEAYEYDLDDNGDAVAGSTLKTIVESVEARMNLNFDKRVKELISESKTKKTKKTENVDGDELDETEDEKDDTVTESLIKKIIHEQITSVYAPVFENWVVNDFGKDFGKVVENWVTQDFATSNAETIQEWATNDFAVKLGEIFEGWVTGDFANKFSEVVENWVVKDFTPEHATVIQEWVTNDFAPKYGEILAESMAEVYELTESEEDDEEVIEAKKKGKKSKKNESDDEDEVIESKKKGKKSKKNESDDEDEIDESEEEETEKIDESFKGQANIFSTRILESIDKEIDKAEKVGEEEEEERKEKEAEKVDESFFQQNAPVWLRMIPENFKPTWASMNEAQRSTLYRKASVRTLVTENDVRRFWDSVNIDSILKTPTVGSRTRVDESKQKPNTRFSRIGAIARGLKS